jgi:hypothetical protein
MLTRKQVKALTQRLDKIANHVESNFQSFGMSKKAAYDFCMYIDQTSDLLEDGARESTTLERDDDEGYMDSFDTPNGPIETEPDEPYMDNFEDDTDDQVVKDDDLVPMTDGDWHAEAGSEDNWYDKASSEDADEGNWYDV